MRSIKDKDCVQTDSTILSGRSPIIFKTVSHSPHLSLTPFRWCSGTVKASVKHKLYKLMLVLGSDSVSVLVLDFDFVLSFFGLGFGSFFTLYYGINNVSASQGCTLDCRLNLQGINSKWKSRVKISSRHC